MLPLSASSACISRPPSITAPTLSTIKTGNSTGTSYTIPPPASQTCGQPACTVQVVIGSTTYNVGDSVPLPLGNTTLTYVRRASVPVSAQVFSAPCCASEKLLILRVLCMRLVR